MNLPDYFEPVNFTKFQTSLYSLGKYALGPVIEKNSEKLSGKKRWNPDVVLLGVSAQNGKFQNNEISTPDRIRKEIYKLAAFSKNLNIIDLGNLKTASTRKGTMLALRDVVEYLAEMNTITVVLGGSQDLTLGICEAFKNNRFFWLSTVDSVPDVKKRTEPFHSGNYLTRVFKNLPNLFQFSLIGYQNQLTGEKLMLKVANRGEHLRLGQLRDDISQAELLLRSSDVLSFDMGALKHIEAPSATQKNPNGLRGEEACQLARYAGLSNKIKVFGLFETGTEPDGQNITAALAAEITWYFLEAISLKKPPEKRTLYKVKVEGLDNPVLFYHEPDSDRWWFEVQSVSGEALEIACSVEEYNKAAQNEIPERWLRYLQKMDGLSK